MSEATPITSHNTVRLRRNDACIHPARITPDLMGIAEPVIGRAFARPVGPIHPTNDELNQLGLAELIPGNRSDKMGVDRAIIPIAAALVVAIVGAVVLFRMDFGTENGVQTGAINMITSATVDRAGATAVPTEQRTQP